MEDYLWIDVSLPLAEGIPTWPGDERFHLHTGERDDSGYIISSLSMSLHCGTHLDAPLHCLPGGSSVDEAPPWALMGMARVVEVRADQHLLPEDLRPAAPAFGERILLKTGNSRLYRANRFRRDYIALTSEAASFLASQGVSLVGIDYLSVEPWEGDGCVHRILAQAGIWILEGLDLSGVEPGEYLLVCLPLRIRGAEASPARVLLGKPSNREAGKRKP